MTEEPRSVYRPATLNPRMMPKLQLGVTKFWNHANLYTIATKGQVKAGMTYSLPGVHCGNEDDFLVQFPPGRDMPLQAWTNHTQHIRAGIMASELYWVSAKFTRLAVMAGHDFDSLVISREELPSPFGLIVYEEPIGEIPRPAGNAAIRAISWTLVPQGIWLNLYMQGEDGDPDVDVEQMRAEMGYLMCPNAGSGLAFDVAIPAEGLHPGFAFIKTIFATWFLMTQPGVAEQRPAPVDKKLARSFQRANGRALPAVQLVDLRRQPTRSKPDTDHVGRPLSVRVYRKGHWKRQAYGPKWGLRKTIYVSAYIAGPEGAPLRERPRTVKVLR
jgi:hypothetical protein